MSSRGLSRPMASSPAVVLFNFNRPRFTELALRRLEKVRISRLYFVCDGPRAGNESDKQLVAQVLSVFRGFEFSFETVELVSNVNLGLKERFESALDYIFEVEPEAIILEDDCEVSPLFFEFALESLETYRDEQQVALISAHNPTRQIPFSANRAFFSSYPRIWGWATWGRVWKTYRSSRVPRSGNHRPDGRPLKNIESLTTRLTFSILMSSEKSWDSWDIWFAHHVISRRLLCLTPPSNLVRNLGVTGPSTNGHDWAQLDLPKIAATLSPTLPREIRVSKLNEVWLDLYRLFQWTLAVVTHPVKSTLTMSRFIRRTASSEAANSRKH
jgi:hypothetical protein